jgi:hypothetical protein
MSALQSIDEVSLRGVRARKILAEARANVANHVGRDERVAAALKTAHDNIVRFDPKRFPSMLAPAHAEQLHRQAAAARQERVKRTLASARDTLKRLSHIKTPSHNSEIVHKIIENARIAPAAPSSTSRRNKAAPVSDVAKDLAERFEVLRAAVPQAMGELIADLRTEWQRDNDLLRREFDATHRELDSLRRSDVCS